MSAQMEGSPSRMRLDELLRAIVSRAQDVLANEDRLQGLLSGVVSLAEQLSIQDLNARIVDVARTTVSAAAASMLPPSPVQAIDHVLTPSRLVVPVFVRGEQYCRIELQEPYHAQGFTEDDLQLVRVVAASAGSAIENALTYAEEERRARWLAASHQITAAILGGSTQEQALALVCKELIELLDAARAVVMLPVRREVFRVAAAAGELAEQILGTEWPYERTVSAEVMRTGRLSVVDDVSAAVNVDPDASAGWGRTVIVPLRLMSGAKPGLPGEALGVITIARRQGAAAGPTDEMELIESFAAQASLALEYSRAQEDRAQLAVFSDRDRISRDLHDLVIQRIFAIGMTVNSMVDRAGSPEAIKRLTTIVDDLDSTIKDIRRTIHELQHDQTGTDSRVQIRRAIAESTPGLSPEALKVDFVGDVVQGIPDTQMPLLLDAIRELVDNVMRHAQASVLEVTVDVGQRLRLVVADDGVGLRPENSRRVGLRRLAELAESFGGQLTLGAGQHAGLVAEWWIPVRDE